RSICLSAAPQVVLESRHKSGAQGTPEASEFLNMAAIKQVGVVGAGQMGGGIAHVCALAGYEVLLNDISPDRIEECLKVIDHNMQRQVSRGVVGEIDKMEAFARIRPAESLTAFGEADLVIEAATENEATKKEIFAALQPHISKTAVLASNTS